MLYPLKFEPILKDKIWGGTKLSKNYNKKTESLNLGESWELSGYDGDESVVTNGFLAGNNLIELIEVYMGDLVGDKVYDSYGLNFPLLFKLIDAQQNLSIQVHPGDEIAAERHNSFGKSEMWYVIEADPGAELILGFKNESSVEEYLEALNADRIENLLLSVKVQKGDVIYIPAGLVHAICKGVLVAEIQQSSDITYRIFDYKRVDADGNERELHTQQALDVINFSANLNPKVQYDSTSNQINLLVTNEYFTTNLINVDQPLTRNFGQIDSFVVYLCVEGSCVIETENEKTVFTKGETVMIPASIREIAIIPEEATSLLEVYVD